MDFCFLAKRDPKFFLFKHNDLFQNFVFFLEIELEDSASFITIRRSVKEATKISFKRHESRHQDLLGLSQAEWDHWNIPFERAKDLLDGLLDWQSIKPWSYRKELGYLLRSQDDFRDVFHLRKFAGPHSDWKPFVAHILGFNDQLMEQLYKKEDLLEKKKSMERTVQSEMGGSVEDVSKIEGILLLKHKEAEKKKRLLDDFDFRVQDQNSTEKLVNEINERIAVLNAKRYSHNQNRKKIVASLKDDEIIFNPDEAELIFKEAGILFKGQIKKDFQQLIDFNRAITDERRNYLREELLEIENDIKNINIELNSLGKERSEMLSFLSETDIFEKYKKVSDEMVRLRADITSLERQRSYLHRLQELRTEIRTLDEECSSLHIQIEANVEKQNSDQNSLFSKIRLFFSEIVEDVIDRKASLSVSCSKVGHLEFKAEILDESGNATSADLGYTYRKLLCIAFDLAVMRAHLNEKYPRFVYHDGVFESLDDRKKENLLTIIRKYAEFGLQPIITVIDSDLPMRVSSDEPIFSSDEIVVTLHDEGEQGRLFKMKTW